MRIWGGWWWLLLEGWKVGVFGGLVIGDDGFYMLMLWGVVGFLRRFLGRIKGFSI